MKGRAGKITDEPLAVFSPATEVRFFRDGIESGDSMRDKLAIIMTEVLTLGYPSQRLLLP